MKVIYQRTASGNYEKGIYLNLHNTWGLLLLLCFVITINFTSSLNSMWTLVPVVFLGLCLTMYFYTKMSEINVSLKDSSFHKEYLDSFMKKDKWFTRNRDIDEFLGINSIDIVYEDREDLLKFYDFCIKEIKDTDFYNPKHYNTDKIYRLDYLLRIHNEMLKKKSSKSGIEGNNIYY